MGIIQRDDRWENIIRTGVMAPPESSGAGGVIKLYVGLGNIGKGYLLTRHSVGFMIIDELRIKLNFPDWQDKPKFHGLTSEGFINGKKIILLKPSTYMNLSGDAIGAMSKFYKIDPSDITLVHDELDLPFGIVKLKLGGNGKTSHNGVKDSAHKLSSTNFKRIRVGIGQEDRKIVDTADFVLAKFDKEEQLKLPDIINQALNLILN
jgi:PTH1 family peptidyl-tRNA hydrolase